MKERNRGSEEGDKWKKKNKREKRTENRIWKNAKR